MPLPKLAITNWVPLMPSCRFEKKLVGPTFGQLDPGFIMTGLKPKTILLECKFLFNNILRSRECYLYIYAKSREILKRDVWPVRILEISRRRDFSSRNFLRNLSQHSFTNFVITNLRIFQRTKMNVVIYIRINKQTQFCEKKSSIRLYRKFV